MLRALTLLLLFQLAGEVLSRLLALPVPGPVIGLVLLFTLLAVRRRVDPGLRATALGILENLSLLFVPAGVGVMVHLAALRGELVVIVVAVFASTLVTIASTGAIMVALTRRLRDRERP